MRRSSSQFVLLLALTVCLLGARATAQAVVVHTIDSITGKPVADVPVTLRYNVLALSQPRRGQILTTHSGRDGRAVFKHVHLGAGGFAISVASKSFAPDEQEPIFLPTGAANPTRSPAITALPAEITIRCRQRTFGERLMMIAKGP